MKTLQERTKDESGELGTLQSALEREQRLNELKDAIAEIDPGTVALISFIVHQLFYFLYLWALI